MIKKMKTHILHLDFKYHKEPIRGNINIKYKHQNDFLWFIPEIGNSVGIAATVKIKTKRRLKIKTKRRHWPSIHNYWKPIT